MRNKLIELIQQKTGCTKITSFELSKFLNQLNTPYSMIYNRAGSCTIKIRLLDGHAPAFLRFNIYWSNDDLFEDLDDIVFDILNLVYTIYLRNAKIIQALA